MPIQISQSDAIEMFDLTTVNLYVCDGKVPDCRKSRCHYNGTGECRHTEDASHALYPMHDFASFSRHSATRDGEAAVICVEPVRG